MVLLLLRERVLELLSQCFSNFWRRERLMLNGGGKPSSLNNNPKLIRLFTDVRAWSVGKEMSLFWELTLHESIRSFKTPQDGHLAQLYFVKLSFCRTTCPYLLRWCTSKLGAQTFASLIQNGGVRRQQLPRNCSLAQFLSNPRPLFNRGILTPFFWLGLPVF